jgi:copper chaperone CopZ
MGQQATGQVTLSVTGMSCGGCAAGVERKLREAPGVRHAAVVFATGQAAVEYDPALTDPHALAALLTNAGYQAVALS